MHIVYYWNLWSHDLGTNFKLGSSIFRALKPTTNSDCYRYFYSGYGTGFDVCQLFSLLAGGDFIKM